MLGRYLILSLFAVILLPLAYSKPAFAQLNNSQFNDYGSRCYDRKSYPEDQVQICMACNGRILVNGVPVALKDIDTLLIKFKSVPKKLRYKVTAKTDVELGAFLALKDLIKKHDIKPDYQITLASRRSLCR